MKNLIIIFLLLFATLGSAQDTLITESDTIITNTGIIEVDQVEVIKAFEAKLDDAQRINLGPKIQPIIPVEKSYDYNITIVPLTIDYPDPVIKPLAMNPDPEKPRKSFFSRLGYGDLNSPYADIAYHGQKGDELEYTISGHFYGVDDSEEIAFREFFESDLNVNVGYLLGENHKLSIDVEGGFDNRNLYDTTMVDQTTPSEDVNRKILHGRARVGFSNLETTDANFNYGAGFTTQTLKFDQSLAYSENGIGLDFFVDNQISSNLSLFVRGDGVFQEIDYASDESRDRTAVNLIPGLNLNIGNFRIEAAADVFIDQEQTSVFPDVHVSLGLLENSLQIYAGTDQVPIANTLWNHYDNNPFVSGFLSIDKTTLSKQFYGGVAGKHGDFLTYNFMAGYADISDQFYYDNLGSFRMFAKHTDMTNVFINANIEFNLTENISLGANASQNFYSPEEIDVLPNMPEYKYSGYSKVQLLNDKLTLSLDLNLMDKISFINENAAVTLGNNQMDVSFGLDFYIQQNIGIWFRANNLLDREYLRFANYPEFGRNLLGGILIRI